MSNSNDPISNDPSRDSVVRLESIGAEISIGVHFTGTARSPRPSPPREAAFSEADLRPGRVIAGRYELVRVLGRGSMGAVWLANHQTLGEEVALKLLAPVGDAIGVESPSLSAARFRFEAQVAARLSRKTRHVVRVTDHGDDGTCAFLVMERLEGQTLERALLSRGPMTPIEVSWLVTQIARGLEVAHAEGILHRDLKPSNIFLADGEDGAPIVKILDFGIARGVRPGGDEAPFATAKGLLFGTPGYMSPEQASVSSQLDSRADLWSLAAIAYEALTGELPVAGVTTEQVLADARAARMVPLRRRRPDLPEACGRFFDKAFAADIDARYASCSELAVALERAASAHRSHGGVRTLAAPTLRLGPGRGRSPLLRGAARRPRHRAKAIVGVVVAVLAIAATWGAFGGASHHPLSIATASAVEARQLGVPTRPVSNGAGVTAAMPSSVAAPERAIGPSALPASPTPPARPSIAGTVSGSNAGLGEFKPSF